MDPFNYDIWYETYDPDFVEINLKSRVPMKWMTYTNVSGGRYKDTILKPINRYIEILYPRPDLISIDNNIVRLRQRNHADFYLLVTEKGIKEKRDNFYNVDRPWIRQYYQSLEKHDLPENCFPGTYKFYVPWFLDADIDVSFESPKGEETPFHVYSAGHKYKMADPEQGFVYPAFVTFHFKKEGSHMEAPDFGVIYKGSAMFDIVFRADDIMIERVRNFYEHYPVLPI